ncbi:putative RNA-directed DNA polymerase [Tanacetum coccineum]|uniref:RNA-directed DNA polymerase n=1 Tax=Tanacetum coccineum TaxID=301880 RepID=A0ABQ5A3Q7_9ASTR
MSVHGYTTDDNESDGDNITLISKLDVSNPLHLHPNDSAALTIVTIKLKGTKNYHVWSNAMLLALEERNKTGFIDGSCRRSNVDEVLCRQWDRVNAVVLGWILNSITEELSLGQIFSKRATHVWEELKETYDKLDGSVTFNLHHKIHTMKQNGSTLADYYHNLNALWKQFDCLIELPRCTCHAADDFKKHNQLMKLMQFLMGLDDSYMSIRSSILSRDPLPDVRNAYATISSEESHRVIASSMSDSSQRTQTAAFASNAPNRTVFQRGQSSNSSFRPNNSTNPGPRPNNNNQSRQNGGSGLVCENCGFNGHTIDRCFKLIGYPADFGKKRNGQNSKGKSVSNNSVSGSSSSSGFTDEQLSTLISLIKDNSVSGKSVQANMAGTIFNNSKVFNDNFDKFFCSNANLKSKLVGSRKIIDSGANQHMTDSDKGLYNIHDISHLKIKVGHPNGTETFISKIGTLKLKNGLILYDVLVIPEYCVTLISVHKLAKDNKIFVAFDESRCYLLNQDLNLKNVLGIGNQCGGLYYLDSEGMNCNKNDSFVKSCLSQHDWHCRLGHPADPVLSVLKPDLKIDNTKQTEYCETCQRAKQTRESFPLSDHTSSSLGDLVHLDLWGPYKVTSPEGFKYFLTVVDDYSRAVWLYLIKTKDEVSFYLTLFYNLIENQFNKRIKIFRSDNGTEFVNQTVMKFCVEKGIIHQTSCAYSPQQNGIAERKHRHLLNVARSLLFQGGIPLRFWTECVLTATYLINRLPSSVLNGKSPFELIYNTKPNLSNLRVFGCLCFATVLNNHDKLGSRSEKCVMMGYSSVKKGYRLYSLDKHQFIFSRDVKFFETVFPFKDSVPKVSKSDIDVCQDVNHLNFFDLDYPEIPCDDNEIDPSLNNDSSNHSDSSHSHVSGENDDIIDIPDSGVETDNNGHNHATHDEQVTTLEENTSSEGNEDVNPMTSSQGNQNLRRSSRVSVFPRNYNDFVVESKVKYGLEKFVGYANLDDENLCFVTELNKSHEPKTFLEASRYPHWADAMNKEMEALLRNDTWELVELPKNRKAISSKWLWKIKYKSNGEIERYKARLVALGCNQREGIDYEETFSPVVKMVTVRCLMNIAVLNDWPMFQLDIDNAFLYGDLDETVYMKPPQGYYDTECNKVCRLKKSLYGLKQAPRQWNAKLTGALIENGFNQSKSDYSLFTKSDNGVFLALLVYVDDIIITGNNSSEIDKFKEFLRTKFMIKDLGNLKYFLGIEVINTDKGICLNQRKYVLDLLSDYGMLACKPARTPMISKLSISNEESISDPLLDNVVDYQKLMGKLIYLTNTRPDISYAVHCLSQFMHAPLKSHLRSAFKILRYLKGSPGLGIHVTKTSGMFLKAYSDADWAKCVVTRKSVTGYCVFINDNLISWKSKKQNTISKSSSESKYRALASVTSEVIWILKVLKDLGYNNLLPVSLYCDSKPAIKIAANPVFHERTKHLEIDLHFVREKILKGIVKTFKVDSANQIADILTKGLDTIQHDKLVKDLGMINLYQI